MLVRSIAYDLDMCLILEYGEPSAPVDFPFRNSRTFTTNGGSYEAMSVFACIPRGMYY